MNMCKRHKSESTRLVSSLVCLSLSVIVSWLGVFRHCALLSQYRGKFEKSREKLPFMREFDQGTSCIQICRSESMVIFSWCIHSGCL